MKKYFIKFLICMFVCIVVSTVFVCISYMQEQKYPFASKVTYYFPDGRSSFIDSAKRYYKILLDSSQNRIDCQKPEHIKDGWKFYKYGNNPFYRSQIYDLASKEARERYNFKLGLYFRYTVVGEQNEYFMVEASNRQYNEYAWILISRISGKIISSRRIDAAGSFKDAEHYYQILLESRQKNADGQERESIDSCAPKAYMFNNEIYDLAGKAANENYNLDLAGKTVKFADWPVALMFEDGGRSIPKPTVYIRYIVAGEQNEYILARIRAPGEEYQIFVLISRISQKVVSTYRDKMPSLFPEI